MELNDGRPGSFGIWPNDELVTDIEEIAPTTALVIEEIRSYGMAVGREVFDTCRWTGRFEQAADYRGAHVHWLGRKEIVVHLCGSPKAKDTNVRRALIDRFGGDAAIRKGGALYGISKDVWSALAIAVAFSDGVG